MTQFAVGDTIVVVSSTHLGLTKYYGAKAVVTHFSKAYIHAHPLPGENERINGQESTGWMFSKEIWTLALAEPPEDKIAEMFS